MNLVVLLFNDFETLDVFGPVEVIGKLEDTSNIDFISLNGGSILSSHQVPVITKDLNSFKPESEYIFLVPGGAGIRNELDKVILLEAVKSLVSGAQFVMSVCTGAALLAKAGILDARKATTNKRLYNWVTQQGLKVQWIKNARWVKDENIYTSSGISAGIDMALGFIADNYGKEKAESIANRIEYTWNKDNENDVFSSLY